MVIGGKFLMELYLLGFLGLFYLDLVFIIIVDLKFFVDRNGCVLIYECE